MDKGRFTHSFLTSFLHLLIFSTSLPSQSSLFFSSPPPRNSLFFSPTFFYYFFPFIPEFFCLLSATILFPSLLSFPFQSPTLISSSFPSSLSRRFPSLPSPTLPTPFFPILFPAHSLSSLSHSHLPSFLSTLLSLTLCLSPLFFFAS